MLITTAPRPFRAEAARAPKSALVNRNGPKRFTLSAAFPSTNANLQIQPIERVVGDPVRGIGLVKSARTCRVLVSTFARESDVNFLSDNAAPVAPAVLDAIV